MGGGCGGTFALGFDFGGGRVDMEEASAASSSKQQQAAAAAAGMLQHPSDLHTRVLLLLLGDLGSSVGHERGLLQCYS